MYIELHYLTFGVYQNVALIGLGITPGHGCLMLISQLNQGVHKVIQTNYGFQ